MCGITGVAKVRDAGIITATMMFALQHRGQEGAKIITANNSCGKNISCHGGLGLVDDVFTDSDLRTLDGNFAVGHVRYSTTGSNTVGNLQPISAKIGDGKDMERIIVAHNGTLTNRIQGLRFSDTDTEQILDNFSHVDRKLPIQKRIYESLKKVKGAFSLIFLYQDKKGDNTLIAVRDPQGMRPLCLGKYNQGYLIASESCTFDKIEGAEFIRFIEPGEILLISSKSEKPKSYRPKKWQDKKRASCVFELIYLLHPTSRVETVETKGKIVYAYQIHEALGEMLAEENPAIIAKVCSQESKMVASVPNSGDFHARGFARASRIPKKPGIVRSHYIGRTFIMPQDSAKTHTNETDNGARTKKILKKFSFIIGILSKRWIILIDDSIVRGNTMRRLVRQLKKIVGKILGISCMIASPPIAHPCFYGVDTPTKKELAINRLGSKKKVCQHINVDDLRYLSIKGLFKVTAKMTGWRKKDFCDACFTGDYPVKISREHYVDELKK